MATSLIDELRHRLPIREYQALYSRPLPTRGNIQLIGSGQTHKREIIAQYLKGYLVPSICQKTNHSKEAVERYIRDFESVKLLSTKFDEVDVISRFIRLKASVVRQYLDVIPLDQEAIPKTQTVRRNGTPTSRPPREENRDEREGGILQSYFKRSIFFVDVKSPDWILYI